MKNHPMDTGARKSEGGAIAVTIALALLTAILLSGCTRVPAPEKPRDNAVVEYVDLPNMDVYTFSLKDGTRCAVMDGYKSGGITCDWGRSERPE